MLENITLTKIIHFLHFIFISNKRYNYLKNKNFIHRKTPIVTYESFLKERVFYGNSLQLVS